MRFLINDNSDPFKDAELDQFKSSLDSLTEDKRVEFRNNNATAIACHSAAKILIVSGPGTGKSTLFKQRFDYWLKQESTAKILALSFVRKLVADLQGDVAADVKLSDEQKGQIEIHTLHKYARSVLEINHGTSELKFEAHFKIISGDWIPIVWNDTLLLANESDLETFSWKNFEKQLHNLQFENSQRWQTIIATYFSLSKFYNAVGFPDLIFHSRKAIIENTAHKKHEFFIVDEYQDFNAAEEELIKELTNQSQGLLLAGDDDQVLYEKLKSGKAELIRNLYQGTEFNKAILPFCSRSSFHITKTAAYFIEQGQEDECIRKIYIPLSIETECPKVQIIGCATSTGAVDYIKKFIEDNQIAIEERKEKLTDGENKDPFLLILTPAKEVKFYASGNANSALFNLVAQFKQEDRKFSEDYYRLLSYYSLANHPENNFTFRKVLYYENVTGSNVTNLIKKCQETNKKLFEFEEDYLRDILTKCKRVKTILELSDSIEDKIKKLKVEIDFDDLPKLAEDLNKQSINSYHIEKIEHNEEEEAELEELEIKQMSAVELLTIVGSKGLSADHVIIIGFDDQNMSWVTRNAFYVAMTRARKTLHIVTALGSGGSHNPHNFLDKLPNQHIEFYKYTKSNRQKTSFVNKADFIKYLSSLNFNRRQRARS